MLKESLHPSGLKIQFHPKRHVYLVNGEAYDSVTSLVYKNFPVFDAPQVAKHVAKKRNVNPEDVLLEWDTLRKESSSFGTKFHQMVELILIKKDIDAADRLAVTKKEKRYLVALKKAVLEIGKNYEFIDAEKIVFSPTLKLAGTIDVLLRNRKTGSLVVADWKTNKSIEYIGYDNGFGLFKDCDNCNFIHYSLQLTLYRHILRLENYFKSDQVINTAILHFQDMGEEEPVKFNKIKPEDFSGRLEQLFNIPRPA